MWSLHRLKPRLTRLVCPCWRLHLQWDAAGTQGWGGQCKTLQAARHMPVRATQQQSSSAALKVTSEGCCRTQQQLPTLTQHASRLGRENMATVQPCLQPHLQPAQQQPLHQHRETPLPHPHQLPHHPHHQALHSPQQMRPALQRLQQQRRQKQLCAATFPRCRQPRCLQCRCCHRCRWWRWWQWCRQQHLGLWHWLLGVQPPRAPCLLQTPAGATE